jgi:hypothetical protein
VDFFKAQETIQPGNRIIFDAGVDAQTWTSYEKSIGQRAKELVVAIM